MVKVWDRDRVMNMLIGILRASPAIACLTSFRFRPSHQSESSEREDEQAK